MVIDLFVDAMRRIPILPRRRRRRRSEKKKQDKEKIVKINKAVYTTTPVAGSWAGAAMILAGACSNTNFPTLRILKNAKKAKCVGRTQSVTDGPTR